MSADEVEVTVHEVNGPSSALETVATWVNDAWGRDKGFSRQDTLDWYLDMIGAPKEAVLIAQAGGAVAGTAAIVACDLESEPELTPWLSALFVAPEHRGGATGAMLLRTVEGRAAAMGFSQIYLYCYEGRLTSYYEAAGWRMLKRFERDGRQFSVMTKLLTSDVEHEP